MYVENILPIRKKEITKENLHTSKISVQHDTRTRIAAGTAAAGAAVTVKALRQPTVRSFFNAIIPLKVITINSTTTTTTTLATTTTTKSNSKHASTTSCASQQLLQQQQLQQQSSSYELNPELKNPLNIKHTPSAAHKFKPLHQPLSSMGNGSSDQSTLCLHSLTSSSTSSTSTSIKHERIATPQNNAAASTTAATPPTPTATTTASGANFGKKIRRSPCALVMRKKHVRGDPAGCDSDGNHKRSFSTSMDHEPFDNDLFDPPPKQHKQQSSLGSAQSPYQQPYAKQQQQRQQTAAPATTAAAYLSAAKNASGHTNLSSSLSAKNASDAATAGAANSRSRSPYADFQQQQSQQYSPKSLTPVSHIVQSGSYVEILKQRTTTDISPTHTQQLNQKRHQRSIAACHNKSYGDFLTITPRRKGNKLIATATPYEQDNENSHNSYHQRIEPLHLLGMSNEKNYTFLDYRAMEAISNADTLEMGTSLVTGNSGHIKKRDRDRYNNAEHQSHSQSQGQAQVIKQSIAEVSSEYQYFMREKNLSPPSAFSDNIALGKNLKN